MLPISITFLSERRGLKTVERRALLLHVARGAMPMPQKVKRQKVKGKREAKNHI
jgi:hypothetical protein